jgi:hypothetical protein
MPEIFVDSIAFEKVAKKGKIWRRLQSLLKVVR